MVLVPQDMPESIKEWAAQINMRQQAQFVAMRLLFQELAVSEASGRLVVQRMRDYASIPRYVQCAAALEEMADSWELSLPFPPSEYSESLSSVDREKPPGPSCPGGRERGVRAGEETPAKVSRRGTRRVAALLDVQDGVELHAHLGLAGAALGDVGGEVGVAAAGDTRPVIGSGGSDRGLARTLAGSGSQVDVR